MVLIRLVAPLAALLLVSPHAKAQDQAPLPLVRRIASMALLASQEYTLGFEGGRVVSPAEIEEAALFLAEAERAAGDLPGVGGGEVGGGAEATESIAAIRKARALVDRTAAPDSVVAIIEALVRDLSQRYGVDVEQIPVATPQYGLGASVYEANCATCHGTTGGGDGLGAVGLDPAPTDLTNADALLDASPLDFYRRVTIGVAGTAMPPFESALTVEERWAVAAYTSTLRLPSPSPELVAPELGAFSTTARMSDRQVLTALGPDASGAALAALRTSGPDASVRLVRAVFASVRRQLDSASDAAEKGDREEARRMAFDAYMIFEQVERQIQVKDRELAGSIEVAFGTFRNRAGTGVPASELARSRRDLDAALARGEQLFGESISGVNLFVQSFILLIREGLEAILVVGALVAFLVKTGSSDRRRDIHIGVGVALAASVLTAIALETVFLLTPAHQEVLEGITMAVAALMLFYVSYWLLSRIGGGRWNRFVQTKVRDALGSGSTFALTAVAFLAVYREGFETVLFYKALMLSAGSGGWVPVLVGVALGTVTLIVVYLLINRYGVRLPLRPFFSVTSAFLYYMGFVFAGKAVAEFQEGGVVAATAVEWAPRVPMLGIYPTVESLVAQGLFVVLALVALVWIFGVRRIEGKGPGAPLSATPEEQT